MYLNETIEMMQSDDYQERFKAEYYQLKIRADELWYMMEKWKNGTLEFTPASPYHVFDTQLNAMRIYLNVLETRMIHEGIKL